MSSCGIKTLVPYLSEEGVNTLCEGLFNLLFTQKGLGLPPKIRDSVRAKARRHRPYLNAICSARTPLTRRRKLLQKGGFIGTLVATALPLLVSLLTNRKR